VIPTRAEPATGLAGRDSADPAVADSPGVDGRWSDSDSANHANGDSPGADLFKRWLWLPGPLAIAYLATIGFKGQASTSTGWFVVAAMACLPAQVLAWLWASHRWRNWTDWRFFGSASLTVISLASMATGAAVELRRPHDTEFRVGISPNDVVVAANALWVSDPTDQIVYRIPEGGDGSTTPIPIPGAFELATDGTTVWVSQEAGEGDSRRRPSLTRLRPDGTIETTRPLPAHPADIAATEDSVWIAFIDSGEVGRVDTTSGRLEVWRVGESPASLAIDGHSLWVTDIATSRVLRMDTATGQVTERLDTGSQPIGIDAADGRVWIANADSNSVTSYDVATRLRSQFRVPAVPTDLAIDQGTLWIVSHEGQRLMAVDAASGETLLDVSLGGQPNKLEVVGSSVFVANPGLGVVHRITADAASEEAQHTIKQVKQEAVK
jgi:DNA-binding beta-propeller fold protein YncE